LTAVAIGSACVETELIEPTLDGENRWIRRRLLRLNIRDELSGASGTIGAGSSGTHNASTSFLLQLGAVRLHGSFCALKRALTVSKLPAAAVVVADHGVEAIDVGLDVVVDDLLGRIDTNLFGDAVAKLGASQHVVSSYGWAILSGTAGSSRPGCR
jgi:hypothetical protein